MKRPIIQGNLLNFETGKETPPQSVPGYVTFFFFLKAKETTNEVANYRSAGRWHMQCGLLRLLPLISQ